MIPRAAISEGSLRRAMRDDRYWRAWHPERAAYVSWVTTGFRELAERGAGSGGTVFVKAYTRTMDGKTVHVAAHQRSAPPRRATTDAAGIGGRGGSASPDAGEMRQPSQATPPLAIPVQGRRRGPSDTPATPRDPGPPMERVPGQTGKEAASNVPSYALGTRRGQNETPRQYADRVMTEQWGDGWRGNRDREAEHQRIQKFGSRAFRVPRIPGARGRE